MVLRGLEQIKRDHPECYRFLLSLARDIYEGKSEAGQLPDEFECRQLEPAVQADLVKLEAREVTFSGPEARLNAIGQHVVESKLLPAWDDQEQFAAGMREVWLRGHELPDCDGLPARGLVLLHNEFGKDIVQRIAAEASEGSCFWDLYKPFTEALPDLRVEPKALKKALGEIQEVTKRDFTGDLIFGSVEELCKRQPETGEALYEVLISEPDSPTINFVPNVLRGLAERDFPGIHQRTLGLTREESPNLVRAGIVALGMLDYTEADRKPQLQTTLVRYREVGDMGSDDLDDALAGGYGNLLQYGREIEEALTELSARTEPQTQHQISRVLFSNVREQGCKPWFKRALMNLAGVSSEHHAIVYHIDNTLHSLAENEPTLVSCFLESWVLSRDYGRGEGMGLTKVLGELGVRSHIITFETTDRGAFSTAPQAPTSAPHCQADPSLTLRS